ncbi:MAG TPA: ABC transporter substrate-binding protein [Chloroflexota bacterium]|nr:ABC transporter substrate-binding protein [Chloroflexota bacterium]
MGAWNRGLRAGLTMGLALLLTLLACAVPAAPGASQPPAAGPAATSPAAPAAPTPAAGPADSAAPSGGSGRAAPAEPAHVRMMVTGQGNESSLYVALERGYFRDEGLDLELVPFDAGPKAIPALGTGDLDLGIGSVGPGLYNAVERGIALRVVAPVARLTPESGGVAFMVRKPLLDSGEIRTPADLRGRRIAVAALASGNEYIVERLLLQNGLQAGDVEWVELSFPDMGAAFSNGNIDAALVADPNGTLYAERGWATKWLTAAQIVPNIQLTFLLFSERFATERGDVPVRWLTAYLRGARAWQTMLDTGEGRDEMLGYLVKHTALKDRALLERIALTQPALDGKIDVDGLRQQAAWARERGYISQDPPLDRMLYPAPFEAALARLGQ